MELSTEPGGYTVTRAWVMSLLFDFDDQIDLRVFDSEISKFLMFGRNQSRTAMQRLAQPGSKRVSTMVAKWKKVVASWTAKLQEFFAPVRARITNQGYPKTSHFDR